MNGQQKSGAGSGSAARHGKSPVESCFSSAQRLASLGRTEAGRNSPRGKSPQGKSQAKIIIKRRGVDGSHSGSPISCDKIFFIVLLVGPNVKIFFKKRRTSDSFPLLPPLLPFFGALPCPAGYGHPLGHGQRGCARVHGHIRRRLVEGRTLGVELADHPAAVRHLEQGPALVPL